MDEPGESAQAIDCAGKVEYVRIRPAGRSSYRRSEWVPAQGRDDDGGVGGFDQTPDISREIIPLAPLPKLSTRTVML
jgi:hypothetical protein